MKIRVRYVLISALTFLLGVLGAVTLSVRDKSGVTPRPAPVFSVNSVTSTDGEPLGYGFGSAEGNWQDDAPRPTLEEFKKLATCTDKTISLVWRQLKSTEEFWDGINPSFQNHDCSGMFEAVKLDLDGDGVKEIKVRGQYGNHCGATGNCSEWVFHFDKRTKKYELIMSSGGEYFSVRKTRSNGYRDIYITTHDSASSSYHLIYRFSRGKYREAKCWFEETWIDGTLLSISCAEKDREYEKINLNNHNALENVEAEWLEYKPAVVELEGKLSIKKFFGPPNFGENPKTDSKEETRILILDKPINVRAKDETDPIAGPSVEDVRELQLVFDGPLKKLVGKKLIVKGTLFHAHTGHHFTEVLLDVESISLATPD